MNYVDTSCRDCAVRRVCCEQPPNSVNTERNPGWSHTRSEGEPSDPTPQQPAMRPKTNSCYSNYLRPLYYKATTRQPGILCGWSGRLEQSTTAHSFRTYIINV